MKNRLIALIIADRTRVLTLLISGSLALSGLVASKMFGMQLTGDHQATITLIVTLLFGWIIEAWAAENNAKGAGQVQELLKKNDPTVKVDRFIGTETVEAVKDAVELNK
jgi:hypothetical protein